MPIRLWSVVTIQLANRPRYHGSGYVVRSTSALAATTASGDSPRVPHQCPDLRIAPAAADGGHLVPPVAHELRERLSIRERRVPLQGRPDQLGAFDVVALRTRSVELLLPVARQRGK